MNDRERLFVAQAFYNAAGELVSTKEAGNLRSEADAYYKARWEDDGSKSFECRLNGKKVGTYSVKVTKPKDARFERRFEIRDPGALVEWAKEAPGDMCAGYVVDRVADFAEWYFAKTGELPDGCNIVDVGTPAMPEQYAGGSLRIDKEAVADALGAKLPEAMRELLEGGDDVSRIESR